MTKKLCCGGYSFSCGECLFCLRVDLRKARYQSRKLQKALDESQEDVRRMQERVERLVKTSQEK